MTKIQKTDITISTSNNEILKGFVLKNEKFSGKRPVILVIHGWTSSTRRFPERIGAAIENGYISLLFDLRGHGQTGYELGKYSRKDHLDDCLEAYDFIKTLPDVDLSNITVLGSSYGGYLAVMLSVHRHLNNIILLAPANYQNEMFTDPQLAQDENVRRHYRLQHHTYEDNDALKAVHDFSGKILLIEAEDDQQVPAQVCADYREAATVPIQHVVISGADHSFYVGETNQKAVEVIADFLARSVHVETLP